MLLIGFVLPIALGVRVPGTYGPGASVLGLIVAGAYLAETIRAGIEAVPKGQMEAARSLGMGYAQAMASIIIPQAFRIMIPPLTNELVAAHQGHLAAVRARHHRARPIEIGKFARTTRSRHLQRHPARGRGARVPGHHPPAHPARRRTSSSGRSRRNR